MKLAAETKSKQKEAMATAETIRDLHMECDWLTTNFETRKQARAGEVESLKNAKAVLSGADYSLIQKATRRLDIKLDINQVVYIENQPVCGGGAGEGALNVCSTLAAQFVSNPAAPAVKVCGTGIKATFFLRGRCEAYYEHSREIGTCNSGAASTACDSFSPAQDPKFGHYQSYLIEQC